MAIALPDAPATARNRDPILAVLRQRFANRMRVLEIGSGTGQHAVYFARALPHLKWHTSDLAETTTASALDRQAGLPNVFPPSTLDFGRPESWPITRHDAIFSANTLHIASWPEVESLFANLPRVLAAKATLVFYGPSTSAASSPRPATPPSTRRCAPTIPHAASATSRPCRRWPRGAGLAFVDDIAMPANNRCLVFEK
jgi:hypothetical protein